MKKSAGILLYRLKQGDAEFFLVHPGGPFWKNKDLGAWTIPKGEFGEDEAPEEAAKREFEEETGHRITGALKPLTPVRLKSGKWVYCWAVEGDLDANNIRSNSYQQEWPPRSGRYQSFPEIDKAGWFDAAAACRKLNPAQVFFIRELLTML